MVMMVKDFIDVEEYSIDLKDAKEVVTELSLIHNGKSITNIEAQTNMG
jgi:hypothetical protein